MPKIAGRNGSLYANITSGGTAEPIAYLNDWGVSWSMTTIEVTTFGDVTKTYVAGLPDFQGKYAGFYDTATAQLYTAATDNIARKFYLYPDRTIATTYWYGTAFFDMSIDVAVGGGVAINGGFAAATASVKIG